MTLVPAFESPPAPKSPSHNQPSNESGSPNQSTPKKRTRITKEQLAHLERLFAAGCTPSVAQRREISLELGVPEKRIQIWFQNRRAKAKNSGDRSRTRFRVIPPLISSPGLCQADQTELAAVIQEEDTSIFVIPVTSLTIGSWNRINREGEQDLWTWVCEQKECLTWFVHSRDYGFKMQVPLEDVTELEFKNSNANPTEGSLIIDLSRAPKFFLKRNRPKSSVAPCGWKISDDWTEGKVASRVLRHVLGGAALPLANIVDYIKNKMATSTVPLNLQSFPYHTGNYCPSSSPPSIAAHTSSGSKGTCHQSPATGRQPMSQSWNSTPHAGTRSFVVAKSPFDSRPNRDFPSDVLGSQGTSKYSDSQDHSDGVDVGYNTPSNRPSPLLVPLKQPYLHPHSSSASFPLPGLSQLFAESEDTPQ